MIDQWLVRQVARVVYARYRKPLQQELVKWQRAAEIARRLALLDDLGEHGRDIKLAEGVTILRPDRARLGNHIAIGQHSILRAQGGITLEDFVLIGDFVVLTTVGHPVGERYLNNTWRAPITLRQNVWLAAGVTVLPGVTIGENSVVGAGAVVTEDIPPDSVAVGVPARVVKALDIDAAALEAQKQALREKRQHWTTRPASL
jgi:acetyltransferase-like isoleucine patch superfamily enzyme